MDSPFLYIEMNSCGLAVHLLHVSDELEHLVRVANLIVIPANNLHEGVGQSDTSLSVED